MNAIADVQNTPDTRNLPIHRVGIRDFRFPVAIASAEGVQHTVAVFNMTVFLPAAQKGTHMSRFPEILEARREPLDYKGLRDMTFFMLEKLQSDAGTLSLQFPFFRRKTAPVSGITGLMDYDVTLTADIGADGYRRHMKIVVPVTSLCPCSKEISDYGAHNQRSHVTVTLECGGDVDIGEVIDAVEAQASCQLYGLLKRPDEKYVTEYAYDHPKFVEDMVRDVAAVLKADSRIGKFTVESENFESIHNHSAYAVISHP